jgi:hypothetical protein
MREPWPAASTTTSIVIIIICFPVTYFRHLLLIGPYTHPTKCHEILIADYFIVFFYIYNVFCHKKNDNDF